MASSRDASIVEYYSDNAGYRCGYCKSPNSNHSHGMWTYSLTVQDYQDLIDRGWRRSGCYCYKPTLHLTCCPMYTIKCSALDFKLSKSQKKKLKRFHNFLAHGKRNLLKSNNDVSESPSDIDSGDDMNTVLGMNDVPDLMEKAERALINIQDTIINSSDAALMNTLADGESKKIELNVPATSSSHISNTIEGEEKVEKLFKSPVKKLKTGDGMDPNRPLCKKAKLLRQERRESKLAQSTLSLTSLENKKTVPLVKSLEDFLNEALPDSPAHRLQIRLVRSSPASKEFKSTLKAAFEVYQRYQIMIHNDSIDKLTEKQFIRFLVNSPLKIKLVHVESCEMKATLNTSWELYTKYQIAIHKEEPDECCLSSYSEFLVNSPLKPWKPENGPPQGYGSFHQQYWLDDRLIAVGVIDILPFCVSSVYFFYDPDYQSLVLGTYGSLREIGLCRSLHHCAPSLQYYYMGFYIHSCVKMRYKGAYTPSFLLCPEVYSWHPIEYCIPLLEKNKYCRFNKDPEAQDSNRAVEVGDVLVLFNHKIMQFHTYISLKQSSSQVDFVTEYASFVGNKLCKRLLLLLK